MASMTNSALRHGGGGGRAGIPVCCVKHYSSQCRLTQAIAQAMHGQGPSFRRRYYHGILPVAENPIKRQGISWCRIALVDSATGDAVLGTMLYWVLDPLCSDRHGRK